MADPVSRTVIVPPKDGGVYFCAFLGDDKPVTRKNIKAEEEKTGEKLDCVVKFWSVPSMGGGFPKSEAEAAYQAGAVLFIKEMPGNWGSHTPRLLPKINKQLKAKKGTYYNQYVAFAKAIAKWGVGTGKDKADKPLFISGGHEMNISKAQEWAYSWAGVPEEYKEFFVLFHDLLLENGAINVTFVFNPNIGEEDSMNYFPTGCKIGGSCVDWVGFDKYQKKEWGSWSDGRSLFKADVNRYKRLKLPMMIAEYGRNRSDITPDEKSVTISGTIDYATQPGNSDGIDLFVYFDTDKADGKWALSQSNLTDFKAGMRAKKSYFRDGIQIQRVTISKVDKQPAQPAQPQPTPAKPTHPTPQPTPAKPTAPGSVLSIEKIQQGNFAFNAGKVTLDNKGYKFSAAKAKDPGFGILTGNADLQGRNTLKFEIRGKCGKDGDGQYGRFIAQVYNDTDNDYTPSVSLDPVALTKDFSTVTVDLEDQIGKAKKVQFLLVTDKGSCSVEIKNIRFE